MKEVREILIRLIRGEIDLDFAEGQIDSMIMKKDCGDEKCTEQMLNINLKQKKESFIPVM